MVVLSFAPLLLSSPYVLSSILLSAFAADVVVIYSVRVCRRHLLISLLLLLLRGEDDD